MPEDESATDPDSQIRGGLLNTLSRMFTPANGEAVSVQDNSNGQHPTPSPSEMRLRVGEFEQARVRDVMIPRVEISAIDLDSTLAEVLSFFADNAHSRAPVYRGTLDDPVGFVHLKDIVSEISRDGSEENLQSTPLSRLKREILYVPASVRLPDLMVKMQSSRIHIALVVDEYGGTDGLVSLEDLVEQIVGDIEDEHDEDTAYIAGKGLNVWEADARALIEDFEGEADRALALENFEDEIDTLGGLVFALAGRVPQRGEIIEHPAGVDFEIVDADQRRIKRLRIRCGAARSTATNTSGDMHAQADKAMGTEHVASSGDA